MKNNSDNIFWINHNHKNVLATKNQNEYIICKPYQNKLAASIINGLEIMPIFSNSKILFLEESLSESVLHVSDMIGKEGQCFIHATSKSTEGNLENILQEHENISNISGSIDQPEKLSLETNFDIVYIDMIKTNLTATALKISELYLKKSGYLFLIIPTTEISVLNDGTYPNDNSIRQQLQNGYDIIQEINLTDFFKNSTLLLCKKIE